MSDKTGAAETATLAGMRRVLLAVHQPSHPAEAQAFEQDVDALIEKAATELAAARARAEKAEALLAKLEVTLDGSHVVKFDDGGWGLQHPVECRPDLFACPINRLLQMLDGPPVPFGYYTVERQGDHDLAYTRRALSAGGGAQDGA